MSAWIRPNNACNNCHGNGVETGDDLSGHACSFCWDGGTPEEHRLRKLERRQRLLARAVRFLFLWVGFRHSEALAAKTRLDELNGEWEGEL